MKILDATPPATRGEGPATRVLHSDETIRVVSFHLLPDQAVAPHSNGSPVVVHVLEGEGLFRGGEEETHLVAGQTLVFAGDEVHSMKPVGGPLRFMAVITRRPR